MMTGMHTIRNIHCKKCRAELGWIYEFAMEDGQRYKEGNVILEKSLIKEVRGFDEDRPTFHVNVDLSGVSEAERMTEDASLCFKAPLPESDNSSSHHSRSNSKSPSLRSSVHSVHSQVQNHDRDGQHTPISGPNVDFTAFSDIDNDPPISGTTLGMFMPESFYPNAGSGYSSLLASTVSQSILNENVIENLESRLGSFREANTGNRVVMNDMIQQLVETNQYLRSRTIPSRSEQTSSGQGQAVNTETIVLQEAITLDDNDELDSTSDDENNSPNEDLDSSSGSTRRVSTMPITRDYSRVRTNQSPRRSFNNNREYRRTISNLNQNSTQGLERNVRRYYNNPDYIALSRRRMPASSSGGSRTVASAGSTSNLRPVSSLSSTTSVETRPVPITLPIPTPTSTASASTTNQVTTTAAAPSTTPASGPANTQLDSLMNYLTNINQGVQPNAQSLQRSQIQDLVQNLSPAQALTLLDHMRRLGMITEATIREYHASGS